ncbi:MAG TPA: hypothetical protein VNU26_08620, partial [Mycobacteriales bacterium]|nr:hypothetical protein [Mycobacteriales bacterium]
MLTRLALLAAGAPLLLSAPASAATLTGLPVDRIADEVLTDGVYVDLAFGVDVDEGELENAVSSA